jgi:hypothetical protein
MAGVSPILRIALVTVLLSPAPLCAVDTERDFSGPWILDLQASDFRVLPAPPEHSLTIAQDDVTIRCSGTGSDGVTSRWSFSTDGAERKYRLRDQTMSTAAKWEGTALLVNTLMSGVQNHVVMDRWKLSRDHSTLTIRRQVVRGTAEAEGILVYKRPGLEKIAPASPAAELPRLSKKTEPLKMEETVVPGGTRIPLRLLSSVDTKHSRAGDRIYLETAIPVARDGRIVIPRGSHVAGTVTQVKRPGRVAGRGELFIRFDSITLGNGTTREFRSRLGASDGPGEVDRKEGKVTSEGNKAGDARKVGEGAGAGASVGVIAGGAAGRPAAGAGIGAAAGAAAGLAGVLLSRGPDSVLAKGTTVGLVLDRDLHFTADELRF